VIALREPMCGVHATGKWHLLYLYTGSTYKYTGTI